MSGIPTREAMQRRYEYNLKLLQLDENVIKSKSMTSGEKLKVAELIELSFVQNREHTEIFLSCISKLHCETLASSTKQFNSYLQDRESYQASRRTSTQSEKRER